MTTIWETKQQSAGGGCCCHSHHCDPVIDPLIDLVVERYLMILDNCDSPANWFAPFYFKVIILLVNIENLVTESASGRTVFLLKRIEFISFNK